MPHVVDDVWMIGSDQLPVPMLSVMAADGTVGGARRVGDMHPAVWDPVARLAAMDDDGVRVHTLLPHVVGFAGERLRFLGDAALWTEAVVAYNDFVLTEFCAT